MYNKLQTENSLKFYKYMTEPFMQLSRKIAIYFLQVFILFKCLWLLHFTNIMDVICGDLDFSNYY